MGQGLSPGSMVVSNNRLYYLYMQYDGGLVLVKYLYGTSNPGELLWWAGKNKPLSGVAAYYIFQADGNFVGYDASAKPVYATGLNGQSITRMVMQDDGNLVWYDTYGRAVMDTKTAGQ